MCNVFTYDVVTWLLEQNLLLETHSYNPCPLEKKMQQIIAIITINTMAAHKPPISPHLLIFVSQCFPSYQKLLSAGHLQNRNISGCEV